MPLIASRGRDGLAFLFGEQLKTRVADTFDISIGTSDVWVDNGACTSNGKQTPATKSSRPLKSSRFFRF